MIKSTTITLSNDTLGTISKEDIIYAEVSEPGAMGNDGGIIIYLIENNQLIRYVTSFFSNEELYISARKLFDKSTDKINFPEVDVNQNYFNYYYGGVGNHAFVNNNSSLQIGEEFFVYIKEHKEYQINCSVRGVFNCVSNAMKNPKNKAD
ncbi:hypothetical protein [Flammeovirga aprica]|uniref:Uncharacterized protein n=1 Tax=Flammeovirga aprica JL-4 TaxID=694437 RepID=A0A7X9RYN4_9BACT|nr:hypothetical protein [Flammeovirga aprica]NME71049.1 hypothetical protein [Flammeovirga aprica JL-4]